MSKPISQREAHALKRRVDQLEYILQSERREYSAQWPGGTPLGSLSWEAATHVASAVYTARQLGHAVVVVSDGKQRFNLYALPHPKVPV